jgi:ATP-dependent RNA helicase RhlB
MAEAVESSLSPAAENEPQEAIAFDSLPVPEIVRDGIRNAGFTHCTPIQAKILPLSLAGRDVAGQAQTGTGKTAAFLITVFTRLIEHGKKVTAAAPRALCIAPTRELAVQIAKDAELLGAGNGLTVQAVYGGVDYKKQRESLRQDVDILVGTPGRLIDYWKQGVYRLNAIEILVVDEADRMFDMGFIKDLRFLLRRCTPTEERQSMMFSATLSHDVMELAYMFMNDAVKVEVNPEQVTAIGVEHLLYHVGKHEKIPALLGILKKEGAERTMVFVNMRRTADHICRTLAVNGYAAEQITGDIEQRKRLKILEDFRDGTLPILVATDVASRGLHIDGVTHVINYDLPFDAEDYVHRVGRTARAGASGNAISLACEEYVEGLESIEKLIGFKLPHDFPDEEMLVPYKHAPRPPRRPRDEGPRRGGERRTSSTDGGRDRAPRGRTRHADRPAGDAVAPPSDAPPIAAGEQAATADGAPGAKKRRRRRGGRGKRDGATATSEGAAGAESGSEGAAASAAPATEGAPGTKKRRRRRGRRSGAAAGEGAAAEPSSSGGSED